MDRRILQAYEALVPSDQLVIDAMISALATRDRQIRDLVAHVHAELDGRKADA